MSVEVTNQTDPVATNSVDKSGRRVQAMFASIAPRYDLLNHLLSLNVDRLWRAYTVRTVRPAPGEPILDCCTGTADLALAYAKSLAKEHGSHGGVIGVDFCHPMLVIGKRKGPDPRVILVDGDAQRLPFRDNTFGLVTVAFGLRNVTETVLGIDEMIRVAKPGGRVAILEFSRPRGPVLGRLYLGFFRHLLPRLGQWLAPNQYAAYRYLPQSVLEFPDGPEMLELLGRRGLSALEEHRLSLGIATLYVGTKPA